MIALIYKDIITLRKSLALALIMGVFLTIQSITKNDILSFSFISALFPMSLMIASLAYDSKAKFETFAFSTPLKRSSYIISKMFFSLGFGILGAIITLVFLISNKAMIEVLIIVPILSLLISLTIPTIFLMLAVKFGVEKARIILVAIYFVFVGLGTLLKERVDILKSVVAFFENIPAYTIGLSIIAFCAILIIILIKISIYIINNKEY
jgi:ABC superfamily ATP binding cassette transporter permease subunit